MQHEEDGVLTIREECPDGSAWRQFRGCNMSRRTVTLSPVCLSRALLGSGASLHMIRSRACSCAIPLSSSRMLYRADYATSAFTSRNNGTSTKFDSLAKLICMAK